MPVLLGGLPAPREQMGKEDQKATCLFKYLWEEWSLASLRRGHPLSGFLGGGVWTETTPRGGGLGWNFHPDILDSWSIGMLRAEALTQTLGSQTHFIMLSLLRLFIKDQSLCRKGGTVTGLTQGGISWSVSWSTTYQLCSGHWWCSQVTGEHCID